jgi:hypothetical protein
VVGLLHGAKAKKVVDELKLGALDLVLSLTLAGGALLLLVLVAVDIADGELRDELVNDGLGQVLVAIVLGVPVRHVLEKLLKLGLGGRATEVTRTAVTNVEGYGEGQAGSALGDGELDADSGIDPVEEALKLVGRDVELGRQAVLLRMVEVEAARG